MVIFVVMPFLNGPFATWSYPAVGGAWQILVSLKGAKIKGDEIIFGLGDDNYVEKYIHYFL